MKLTDPQNQNVPIPVLADPVDIIPYLDESRPTMVFFEMTTCPYCRMFEERFVDFSRSRSRDYKFMRVVLDDPGNPLWHLYEIQAVPTVIVFAEGRAVSRIDSVLFLGITKKNWVEFCAGL